MLKFVPEFSARRANGVRRMDLLLEIEPEQPSSQRPPLALTLILDVSGSMEGAPIHWTRRAAVRLLQQLKPGDAFGLITFGDQACRVVPLSKILGTGELASWTRLIEGVSADGSTNMHDGLALFQASHLPLQRVILLSDGCANVGPSSPLELEPLARQCKPLTTVGFGLNYHEHLLRHLASAGLGNHYFVQDEASLSQFFDLELSNLAAAQGCEVELELETGGGLRFNWLNQVQSLAPQRIALGDLLHGSPLRQAIELEWPESGDGELLARLSWKCPLSGQRKSTGCSFQMPCSDAPITTNLEVQEWAGAARAGHLRDQALQLLRQGQRKPALDLLKKALQLPLPAAERQVLQRICEHVQQGEDNHGHKLAASHGHGSGHGRHHYVSPPSPAPTPHDDLGLKPLTSVPPWERVEGLLRGFLYGERLALGRRGIRGEGTALGLASLEACLGQPWSTQRLGEVLCQVPVLHPSPSLAHFRQTRQGRPSAGYAALRWMPPLLCLYAAEPGRLAGPELRAATWLTHQNSAASQATLGYAALVMEAWKTGKMPRPEVFLELTDNGQLYPCKGGQMGVKAWLTHCLSEARKSGLSLHQAPRYWGQGPYLMEFLPHLLYALEMPPEQALSYFADYALEGPTLASLYAAIWGAAQGSRADWFLEDTFEERLHRLEQTWQSLTARGSHR